MAKNMIFYSSLLLLSFNDLGIISLLLLQCLFPLSSVNGFHVVTTEGIGKYVEFNWSVGIILLILGCTVERNLLVISC